MGDIWSTDDTVAPGGADPLAWVLPVGTPPTSPFSLSGPQSIIDGNVHYDSVRSYLHHIGTSVTTSIF